MQNNDIATILILAVIVFLCLKFFPRQKGRVVLSFIINNQKIEGVISMIQISATQKQRFKVNFTDAKGNPAQVQAGSVSISVADEAVATVVRDPEDETTFDVLGASPGTTQLNVTADADMGDGVKTISDFSAVEIRPGEAVGVGIVPVGEVQEQ